MRGLVASNRESVRRLVSEIDQVRSFEPTTFISTLNPSLIATSTGRY